MTKVRIGGCAAMLYAIASICCAEVKGATPGKDAGAHPGPTKKALPAAYRIVRLRAFLYFHEKAKFGVEDILTGTVPLQNVYIGNTEERSSSDAVLVVADIEGPGFRRNTPEGLYLVVSGRTAGGRQLGSTRIHLRDFRSSMGQIALPAMIYGVSCEPVYITAALEGVLGGTEVTAVAEFGCSE